LGLKNKIQAEKPDYAVEKQKLILTGKILKDEDVVSSLNLKENDFIVCMVAPAKVSRARPFSECSSMFVVHLSRGLLPFLFKIQPAAKPAATTTAAPPVSATTPATPTPVASTPVSQSPSVPSVAAPAPAQPAQEVSADALASLIAIGFPEDQVRAALIAAQNNPDLAFEFLQTGIPEFARGGPSAHHAHHASPPHQQPAPAGGIDQLRQHPQFNQLKQLIQANPAALPQVMSLIGQQSPDLLAAIHADQQAFVAMMNEPISATPAPQTQPAPSPGGLGGFGGMGGLPGAPGGPDIAQVIQMLASMPAEQRAQIAQSMGMTAEQLQGMMQMAALSGLGGGPGGPRGGVPPGATAIHLTQEELDSVNRLVALGFSQQQAVEAYLACDKNEAMAANLLFDGFDGGFEGGFGGDFEGDGDGGDGGDDDMYG
jgi:UV excision repair protein RAD23